MATYKIRRTATLQGGLSVPSTGQASTFATPTTFSGCVLNSASVLNTAKFQQGSVGTAMSVLGYGTSIITATSTGAGSVFSTTITVPNLNANGAVFATTGSLSACLVFGGAWATAASVLTLKFYNAGSATTADAAINVSYMFVR